MSKPKHEAAQFKAALLAGLRYAEGRGAVQFQATDSISDKALYQIERSKIESRWLAITPRFGTRSARLTMRSRPIGCGRSLPREFERGSRPNAKGV